MGCRREMSTSQKTLEESNSLYPCTCQRKHQVSEQGVVLEEVNVLRTSVATSPHYAREVIPGVEAPEKLERGARVLGGTGYLAKET